MTTRRQRLRLLRSATFLRACVRQGLTCRQIAARLGVNRTTVREHMRERHIRPVQLTTASSR